MVFQVIVLLIMFLIISGASGIGFYMFKDGVNYFSIAFLILSIASIMFLIIKHFIIGKNMRHRKLNIVDMLRFMITFILVSITISSFLYDYKFEEEKIITNYDNLETEELYDMLIKIDPCNTIHPNNRKRIIRALNYCVSNNKPFSSKEKTDKLLYDTLFIGLSTDRSILYDKINKRVDKMVKNGLIEEAKKIYDSGIRSKAIMTPIGYKELFSYFDNKMSLDDCLDKIKQKSRNYAKRQYTWFNHQMKIKWFDVNYDDFDKTIEEVYNYIEKNYNI